MHVTPACQVFSLLTREVASEIHITEDELVILLGAPERVMNSWNVVGCLVCIEELCAAVVGLLGVSESLLYFLLT